MIMWMDDFYDEVGVMLKRIVVLLEERREERKKRGHCVWREYFSQKGVPHLFAPHERSYLPTISYDHTILTRSATIQGLFWVSNFLPVPEVEVEMVIVSSVLLP